MDPFGIALLKSRAGEREDSCHFESDEGSRYAAGQSVYWHECAGHRSASGKAGQQRIEIYQNRMARTFDKKVRRRSLLLS